MSSFLRRIGCVCLAVLLSITLVSAHSFTDVPAGHWAEAPISQGVELGVFNGTTATTFSPSTTITRGAFVVLLSRLLDWDTTTPTTPSFTDVSTTSWWYGAIEAATAQGAVTTQYTTFRPNEAITREEMAVMLVRALGYGNLAGLVQDLSMPFSDVTTNRGYIAIINELGLMTGTTATTFNPSAYTTRAQTAVILMRLYDKLHAQQTTYAIVSDLSDTQALESQAVVALTSATLSTGSTARINPQVSASNQQAAIETIHQNGGTALLHISATSGAMKGTVADTVEVIVNYVNTVGYDGVFLYAEELTSQYRTFYTQLVQGLDQALGAQLLYVMAEAPAWQGTLYGGYDYTTLSNTADRLVLRIAPYVDSQDGFLIAPLDPMEEVYYALTHLPTAINTSTLSLLVTTTAASRTGTKGFDSITAEELSVYFSSDTAQIRTSERYDCQYLFASQSNDSTETVVWYLSGEQVANRLQLCALFDIDSIVLSNASSLLDDVSAVLP